VNYINKLYPQGTNSTHFTECCNVAITDGEKVCPRCKEDIIGFDAPSDHERRKVRWAYATSNWRKPNEQS
jgi:hypothetical protein